MLRKNWPTIPSCNVQRLLAPFNLTSGKIPHYCQEIAIHHSRRETDLLLQSPFFKLPAP